MMPPEHSYDALVVGGGLVGASCAIALARCGLKVGLLDKRQAPAIAVANMQLDSRVYSITPANAAWLTSLGVWAKLDPERISTIDEMEIWGDADAQAKNEATLRFQADGIRVPHLAFVLEEQVLQTALQMVLDKLEVDIITGEAAALEIGSSDAHMQLADGLALHAQLVVAADGGSSTIRALADIAVSEYQYEQAGVVANYEITLPHRNIARQWFSNNDVMAWLPLPGNRISLVWSTRNAGSLSGMDADKLSEAVAEEGGRLLGKLIPITPARNFPLVLRTASSMVKPRVVLVGDAAHQIHPLAGQGVNLGFRDVIKLAEVMDERKPYEDFGSHMVLRRYERARKLDLLGMQTLTHGLNFLFESNQPMLKALRNWGMQSLDNQTSIKRQLIRQAVQG